MNEFRAGLRERNERYVVDVREDLRMRDLRAEPPRRKGDKGRIPTVPPVTSAKEWSETQPESAWNRFEIRGGEKGPLLVEAAQTWVETFEDTRVGPQERFTVIRTVNAAEKKIWYTLSNAAEEVPQKKVVWAHAQRYWEEANFKEGKSEIGLGHYETRSWRGWHHHMTMSLLALWFLGLERDRVKKKTPAITVSVLREVFSMIIELGQVTLATIVRQWNATMKRKEEARIYYWVQTTKMYPPSRSGGRDQGGEASPCSKESAANAAPRPPPYRPSSQTHIHR